MHKYPEQYYQNRDKLVRYYELKERYDYAVTRHTQAFKFRMRALKKGRLSAATYYSERQALWYLEVKWLQEAIGNTRRVIKT